MVVDTVLTRSKNAKGVRAMSRLQVIEGDYVMLKDEHVFDFITNMPAVALRLIRGVVVETYVAGSGYQYARILLDQNEYVSKYVKTPTYSFPSNSLTHAN